MKRIVCDMCGSTDLLKQDGVFVCQNCMTKYTVEEARKMMVEGTVEVVGTIKVDNSGLISNYLIMAKAALDVQKWNEAEQYSNKVIEIEPRNHKAWFYKGWSNYIGDTGPQYYLRALEYCPENEFIEFEKDVTKTVLSNLNKDTYLSVIDYCQKEMAYLPKNEIDDILEYTLEWATNNYPCGWEYYQMIYDFYLDASMTCPSIDLFSSIQQIIEMEKGGISKDLTMLRVNDDTEPDFCILLNIFDKSRDLIIEGEIEEFIEIFVQWTTSTYLEIIRNGFGGGDPACFASFAYKKGYGGSEKVEESRWEIIKLIQETIDYVVHYLNKWNSSGEKFINELVYLMVDLVEVAYYECILPEYNAGPSEFVGLDRAYYSVVSNKLYHDFKSKLEFCIEYIQSILLLNSTDVELIKKVLKLLIEIVIKYMNAQYYDIFKDTRDKLGPHQSGFTGALIDAPDNAEKNKYQTILLESQNKLRKLDTDYSIPEENIKKKKSRFFISKNG